MRLTPTARIAATGVDRLNCWHASLRPRRDALPERLGTCLACILAATARGAQGKAVGEHKLVCDLHQFLVHADDGGAVQALPEKRS